MHTWEAGWKREEGQALRLSEWVSNRTETASKELLGQAQERGSTGDLEQGGVCEEAREARGGAGDYSYSELCGALLPQRTGKEPLDL